MGRVVYFDPADASRPANPQPADPMAASHQPVDDVTRAQRAKAATNQVQTVTQTTRNIKAALQGVVAAQLSRDEQEKAKAQANWEQALADLRRLNQGASGQVEDPNETPFVGNGSGLRQVANFAGSFFVPQRQLLSVALGNIPPGEWWHSTWQQLRHPSLRQNAGDVIGETWDRLGHPVARVVPPSEAKTRAYVEARRQAQDAAAGRLVPTKAEMDAAKLAGDMASADAKANPQTETTQTLAGIGKGTAQVGAELAEILAPTPGSGALKVATKFLVGKPLAAAGRAVVKAADKTQAGKRLLDFATFGGSLRRVPEALAGQPELPDWVNSVDEFLESNVAAGQRQHAMVQKLRDSFAGLTPAEKTLVLDSVEHPEVLSGNPRLLEPLARKGVDVSGWINPKASLRIGTSSSPAWNAPASAWSNPRSPGPVRQVAAAVADQVTERAAKAGIPGAVPGAITPPDEVVRGWLQQISQRPDIKKLWPARQAFLSLQEATRAERMGVDLSAANIAEPYIRHVSTPAAEHAMRSKGLAVQATDPQVLAGNVARSQGQRPVAGLTVIPEKSRHLQDDLFGRWAEEPSFPPPADTRLELNAAMARAHPELAARDFFSGQLAPQAEKLAKDIRETEVLRLLQSWSRRGKPVTDQLPEAMSAAPGGVGNWQVPQSKAWQRVAGDRQIAVPLPVAEFIDQQGSAGRGFYDTLMDIATGRAPAATRTPGKLYSPLSELFKIPATVMNPRYYIRNWGGNWDQLYKEFGAAGAPFSPQWWADRELRKTLLRGQYGAGDELATPLTAPNGKTATLGELRDAMTRRGMLGETNNAKVPIGPRIEQELADLDLPNPKRTKLLRALNPLKPSTNPLIQGAAEKFGRGPEEAARAQATIRGFLTGGDVAESVGRAEELLFNPNRTSEAMNRISGLFPFVRWWGKNIPLQAEQFVNHPDRFYNLSERIPDLSRRITLSPEEYKQSKSRPVGQYLSESPLYWTGLRDKVGQPVVMPYPFSTEAELYDMAKAALNVPRDIAQKNIPDFPLTRTEIWDALLSRANPMVQFGGEPNRDILRGTTINTEIRDPNGILIGYQEGTGKAGAAAELMHRAAERMGWPQGKQLPVLATSHDPGSAYVFQDAATKRMMEQIPVLSAFPLSMLRLWSQNSQLEPAQRVLMPLGMSLQSVPWYQTEANRPYQTREQIEAQKKTSRQKSQ